MKKFKINILGTELDSSTMGKGKAEILIQDWLNSKGLNGRVNVTVNSFDNNELKLSLQRSVVRKESVVLESGEYLFEDHMLLFPHIYVPCAGLLAFYNSCCDCQNTLDEINRQCRITKCSKLKTLDIQTYPDHIDVTIMKA